MFFFEGYMGYQPYCLLPNIHAQNTQQMSLHALCSEEMICCGAIGYIFSIIETSQRGGTNNSGETKQVLLKLARNLSSFTRRLQCKLAEALEAQDMSPLKSVVKDPESYIHTELITEDEEEIKEDLYFPSRPYGIYLAY